MRVSFLGVPVDALSRTEVRDRIEAFLHSEKSHLITTPNPEMVVAAQSNGPFLSALQSADLAVADGFGLKLYGGLIGSKVPERIPGVELIGDICTYASLTGQSVYLLGGAEGVAGEAAKKLKEKFALLKIAGAESGGSVASDDGRPRISEESLRDIKEKKPRILLVAFGHEKQEQWLHAHLPELPSVKIAMGVGGSFDFIAGRARRAPTLMRRAGLEWLWRLALEPRRAGRIWNATIVFPWLIVREKMSMISRNQ